MNVALDTTTEPWNCVFLLISRYNMMALTSLLDPLRVANYLSTGPLYTLQFCSFESDLVTSSSGMAQACQPPPEKMTRHSTIFVLASWGGEKYKNKKLMSWLRHQHRCGVQICGVELGAFIVAEAGLLANRKATTHWSYLRGFQEKYPLINVVEQLYTENDQVTTCAGGTAGFDLVLSFIRQYRGKELAGEVADQIMHHPLRPPEAPQRVTHGHGIETLPLGVRGAVQIIEANIEDPMRVSEIAELVEISQRQLERRFNLHFGCTVARFSQLLRLQHARVLLVSTTLSISEISTASGFNTQSHFNQVFKKCFGRNPSAYRTAWPESDPVLKWPGTLASFITSASKMNKLK